MKSERVGRTRPAFGRATQAVDRATQSAAGQATVEAVAGIGTLMLAGLVCFQLLAAGYSASVADGAAAAGAVALVRGEPVEPAVRDALPGWARERVSVSRVGMLVRVRLEPPALLPSMSDALSVTAEAGAKPG